MDRKNLPSYYTEEDRKLISLFKQEMNRLDLLYMKAVHSYDITKANELLKRMKSIADYLYKQYGKWADIKIPTEYIKGAKYIDNNNGINDIIKLGEAEIQEELQELGPVHIEAVNALLNNSKNYVRSSLDGMERQAITMVNELQQEQIRGQLAKGVISGEGLYNMNKNVQQYFTANGITGFKDRGGKYWSMDRYVDMLTRTETSIANTQGTINRALQLGITKFKIVERPDCCKECYHQHGGIVDISKGTVELPPFHPNCRGYVVAVVGDDDSQYMWQELGLPNVEMYEYLKNDIDKVRKKGEWPIGVVNEAIIRNYTGRSYENINEGVPQRVANKLDEIIIKNADYSGTVYRGMAFTPKEWESYLASGKITHQGFMSSSQTVEGARTFAWLNNTINPDKTVRVVFKLENTRGGMDIENYARKQNQKEVLFGRGKTIDIDVNTSVSKGKYIYINGSII